MLCRMEKKAYHSQPASSQAWVANVTLSFGHHPTTSVIYSVLSVKLGCCRTPIVRSVLLRQSQEHPSFSRVELLVTTLSDFSSSHPASQQLKLEAWHYPPLLLLQSNQFITKSCSFFCQSLSDLSDYQSPGCYHPLSKSQELPVSILYPSLKLSLSVVFHQQSTKGKQVTLFKAAELLGNTFIFGANYKILNTLQGPL